MNKFLNWVAELAEWAGRGDYFLGFLILVAVSVVLIIAVFVVINIIALSGIPG